MNLIEEILFITGIAMMPYGIYEILKGNGTKGVKALLAGISIGLFLLS
ncbi:hypothetical protein [Candidatus Acidianus copahuensis]|nr:hypothetical protein [Candidatus Acidianus copahuensis]